MRAISRAIVKGRKLLFLLFLGLIVFSLWGIPRVNVEYSITTYLPPDTDTKKALDIMEEEFTT